ncbi:MAG: ribosomal protein S18-alanine N-acetyltransferase, partial [Candidatus Bathyarchaeia archaeon]
LDEVVRINWTCLPENYDNSFFMDIYYRFPRTFIVAKVGEKVVGYIMCRTETGFSERKRFSITRKGHIVSIAVLPEYRNRGIGSSLVEKAIERLKEYHATEIFLEVRVSNKAAINLYKKFGFSTSREILGYYRDGETALVMVRPLA